MYFGKIGDKLSSCFLHAEQLSLATLWQFGSDSGKHWAINVLLLVLIKKVANLQDDIYFLECLSQ